ncbi:unnamed protein product [Brassica oleracea var. botrytis]
MCECGMSDGFEPVSVLKGYVKDSRDAAERVCKEDKYSLKSQNEATDKEVSALKAVIKIIKDRNLEAEYSEERVEERVEELERQKAQRKRNVEPPQPKPKGRKRPRDRSGTQVPRQEAGGVMIEPSHHHGLQLNPFGVCEPSTWWYSWPLHEPSSCWALWFRCNSSTCLLWSASWICNAAIPPIILFSVADHC